MLEDLTGSHNDLRSNKNPALVRRKYPVHNKIWKTRKHGTYHTNTIIAASIYITEWLETVTTIHTICGDPQCNNITKLILHSTFNK